MSQPWFKFYPRDWRGDQALRAVSMAARGLWMECLCIMHEAKPYGHLLLNGDPVEGDALARMTGMPVEEARALMHELHKAGVLSVTSKGVVFSRRMTKDHARACKGRLAVKKRYRQVADDVEQSAAPTRLPTRSPSTQKPEVRGQEKRKTEATASSKEPDGFAEWYGVYPKRVERKAAAKAYGKAAKEVPRERLIDAARRYAERMRARGEPQFIKHPAVWLNKGCWDDEETTTNGHAGKSQAELEALYAILDAPSPRRDGGELPRQGESLHPRER